MLTLRQGSGGETIAADENFKEEQYVQLKLADATADSAQVVESGNGTSTAALRVSLASDSGGVVSLSAGSAAFGSADITDAETSGIASQVDVAATVQDKSVTGLAKRTAAPSNYSGSDGDYEPLQMDGGYTHTSVAGVDAHDSTASANPVLLATEAVETDGTAAPEVVEGDVTNIKSCLNGLLLVQGL